MGIDYGKKRVGIALSDESGQFALPYDVLANSNTLRKKTEHGLIKKIKKMCDDNKVGAIVLGESKNFKGQDNSIMKEIKIFRDNVIAEIKLPLYMEPEFMTSAEAKQIQGKNDMLDASAAAIILKSYLDKNFPNKIL
jgi:putative Holliday junction resolvase